MARGLVLGFNQEGFFLICVNDNSVTEMPPEEPGENNPMKNTLSPLFILLAWACKYFPVPWQRPTPSLSYRLVLPAV